MVIDYEMAWHRLGELVASKPQHGQHALLVEMQKIATECRVPSGELARLLRLYGVEVERIRRETEREADPDSDADALGAGTARSPHVMDRGGHDDARTDASTRAPAAISGR